ncbi:MAG: branched chain amino acid aminotransferase [Ignavibacteria bacterium GWA2_54_16]|nr:MAG: branched chain amino acid aminotransferase [Ignavibacteria bacterium GWA2_54_16]
MNKVEKIWMNGALVNWDDAKVHVLTHAMHYGSSWFEGIRCYETKRGSAIFRHDAHLQRLIESAKMYRSAVPYTIKQLQEAVKETIRVNGMKSCYIRPLAYRGYGEVGVFPLGCPVEVMIAVWNWGAYLGSEALDRGIDVCVSSWNRPAPNTLPTMSKAGGNYLSSQLIKMEAVADGYAEGIALDTAGYISEGSGENIFIVRDGIVYTPPLISAILPGITRSSVFKLMESARIRIVEGLIPREMLYIADEVFFTGTAAEITPIRSVDKMNVGDGNPGPVTKKLQEMFYDVVRNGNDTYQWLDFVYD